MKNLLLITAVMIFFSCGDKKVDGTNGMPTCLTEMIDKQKVNKMEPEVVYQYNYMGKVVYYLEAQCCDQFNSVFDVDCKFLGSPDGGMEGTGDGKLPDFGKEAKDKKEVWRKK